VSALIALEDLRLALAGRRILSGVSLTVAPGETLGVLGPSGSGKTTLLRLVLGLQPAGVGKVWIDGTLATEGKRVLVPPEQRGLGVVFQDLGLWPHLSVAGNLEFGLAARGIAREERRARVASMLADVGLEGFARRRPGDLSGGERQRVAIARALVAEPRAVLFDEPLSNLDAALRKEMLRLFAALLRKRGTAAIYVTHDARELAGLAGRVAVLEEGRIAQEGSLDALRQCPATPFVEAILQEEERP